MSFDSPIFISCFLPLLALIYAPVRNQRARNVLLLAAGLVFYAFGSLTGLLLLLACAAVNYGFGCALQKRETGGKGIAAAAIALDLAFLAAFKYLKFALSVFAPRSAADPFVGLAAPIGLSFFTFKCISYILDTLRDRKNGTKRFFDLLLYISFFPQIMAGPITRFPDFRAQLDQRTSSLRQSAEGLRRFVAGLSKKLIFAGAAAAVTDRAFAGSAAPDARLAWLGAAAYMLQIYFDFSGYSDMAIGLGRMFGFMTPENFAYPYIAPTITEFWRRWHISLSGWFRDYLYIPLGGSRRGRRRAAVNKLIVFVLCGLWHGAGWTYLLWGAWHGVLSAAEGLLGVKRMPEKGICRVVGHIYTLLAVCLGFVFFRAETLAAGWRMLRAMLGFVPVTAASTAALYAAAPPLTVVLLILGAVFAMPVKRLMDPFLETKAGRALSYAGSAALLALCCMRMAAGGFAPFIYFQF